MLISFEQRHMPARDNGPAELTINRATLFGEIEPFLVNAFRATSKDATDGGATWLWAAHISRGANYMQRRVNSIADLGDLLVQ